MENFFVQIVSSRVVFGFGLQNNSSLENPLYCCPLLTTVRKKRRTRSRLKNLPTPTKAPQSCTDRRDEKSQPLYVNLVCRSRESIEVGHRGPLCRHGMILITSSKCFKNLNSRSRDGIEVRQSRGGIDYLVICPCEIGDGMIRVHFLLPYI
jgi:hypothetical protein